MPLFFRFLNINLSKCYVTMVFIDFCLVLWKWILQKFPQRDRALADGCFPSAAPAGWKEMHVDHEDGALGDALDRLPQPQIQYWQSNRYKSLVRSKLVSYLMMCSPLITEGWNGNIMLLIIAGKSESKSFIEISASDLIPNIFSD